MALPREPIGDQKKKKEIIFGQQPVYPNKKKRIKTSYGFRIFLNPDVRNDKQIKTKNNDKSNTNQYEKKLIRTWQGLLTFFFFFMFKSMAQLTIQAKSEDEKVWNLGKQHWNFCFPL